MPPVPHLRFQGAYFCARFFIYFVRTNINSKSRLQRRCAKMDSSSSRHLSFSWQRSRSALWGDPPTPQHPMWPPPSDHHQSKEGEREGGGRGGARWNRFILISTTSRRKDDTGSEVPVATEIDTDLNVIGSSSRLVDAKKAFFSFLVFLVF